MCECTCVCMHAWKKCWFLSFVYTFCVLTCHWCIQGHKRQNMLGGFSSFSRKFSRPRTLAVPKSSSEPMNLQTDMSPGKYQALSSSQVDVVLMWHAILFWPCTDVAHSLPIVMLLFCCFNFMYVHASVCTHTYIYIYIRGTLVGILKMPVVLNGGDDSDPFYHNTCLTSLQD